MHFSEIKIIRSKRKTIGLEVQENGAVILRAPQRASVRSLQSFVQEKESWLGRNVKKQKRSFAKRPRRIFKHGEEFLYLGNALPLLTKEGLGVVSSNRPLEVTDAFYLCTTAQHKAEPIIKRWYKSRARFVFNDRAEFYAPLMNVDFENVKLSSAKTRWGSCGSKNTLNFNWRLIMAPMEVIDSVVIHELAHCKHKNHGKRFWSLVTNHCSDYKRHDRWLKSNAPLLHWD